MTPIEGNEELPEREDVTEKHSFDEMTKSGRSVFTRQQVLRGIGVAIAGVVLYPVPETAGAQTQKEKEEKPTPPEKKKERPGEGPKSPDKGGGGGRGGGGGNGGGGGCLAVLAAVFGTLSVAMVFFMVVFGIAAGL